MTGAKKVVDFFMPVNHVKEFLKSVHNEVLFWQLFARPLIQLSSTIFKANFLKMVSINSEFLVVSMVNTAPESPTTLVTLVHTIYLQWTTLYLLINILDYTK